jgi:hypothetical protein
MLRPIALMYKFNPSQLDFSIALEISRFHGFEMTMAASSRHPMPSSPRYYTMHESTSSGCRIPSQFEIRTLTRILAPRLKPQPNNFLFGQRSRAHMTIWRTSLSLLAIGAPSGARKLCWTLDVDLEQTIIEVIIGDGPSLTPVCQLGADACRLEENCTLQSHQPLIKRYHWCLSTAKLL